MHAQHRARRIGTSGRIDASTQIPMHLPHRVAGLGRGRGAERSAQHVRRQGASDAGRSIISRVCIFRDPSWTDWAPCAWAISSSEILCALLCAAVDHTRRRHRLHLTRLDLPEKAPQHLARLHLRPAWRPARHHEDGQPLRNLFCRLPERAQRGLKTMGGQFPELGLRLIGVGLGDVFQQSTEGTPRCSCLRRPPSPARATNGTARRFRSTRASR